MNLFNYLMNKKGHKIVDNNHMLEYLLNSGEEPIIDEPMRLINGENFNVLVKNLNTTEATIETNDTSITKIVFDYWNKKYKSMFKNFSNGTDVSYENNGNIRLFNKNSIIYVLSSYHIKVINGSSMFQALTIMTEINFDNFDTSECTDLSKFMYNCSSLTTQRGMETFNTSNCINMETMLRNTNFNKIGQDDTCNINVSNWNTSKVQNLSNMFRECKATFIDISNFLTPVCARFRSMFFNCTNLVTLNMENIDMSLCDGVSANGTANDTNFAYGINNCGNLINLTFAKNLGVGYTQNRNLGFSSVYLGTCNSLSHDSILSIFNNIGKIRSSTWACNIYMGITNYNKVNSDEIQIISSKWWNVTSQTS